MDYSFNSNIATVYGVDCAVMIHNIHWWIEKNEANGRHYFDGRHWTYNSMEAFVKLFPFWTKKQIWRIIENLKAKGAVYIGNYNEKNFDRTQWYALSEDILDIYEKGKCILPNGNKDITKRQQGNYQTVTAIPDSKQQIVNTENKLVSKKVSKERERTGAREYQRESYAEILTRLGYSEFLQAQIFKFIQFQQANKKIVTNAMLEQTMRCIEGAAERRVRNTLPGGFMEQIKADISLYHDDIENYIQGAIQQALNGQWHELKEPKGFKTAAEWEAQAVEDMKMCGI